MRAAFCRTDFTMPGSEGNSRWRPTKTAKYGVGKRTNLKRWPFLVEMATYCSQSIYNYMESTRDSILREGSTVGCGTTAVCESFIASLGETKGVLVSPTKGVSLLHSCSESSRHC